MEPIAANSGQTPGHEGYHPSAVDRVRSREVLLGTFAALGSPLTAEICGSAGFDWVLVDLEHGAGMATSMCSSASCRR